MYSLIEKLSLSRELLNYETLFLATKLRSRFDLDPPIEDDDWYSRSVINYTNNPLQMFKSFTTWEQDKISQMDTTDQSWYMWMRGAEFMWNFVLYFTKNTRWKVSERSGKTNLIPEFDSYAPNLKIFLQQLPFEQIGRIVFLGVLPNKSVNEHDDEDHTDHLLISFQEHPKILHCENMSLPITMIHIDETKKHSISEKPYFTYTIRVDGKFTKNFKDEYITVNP